MSALVTLLPGEKKKGEKKICEHPVVMWHFATRNWNTYTNQTPLLVLEQYKKKEILACSSGPWNSAATTPLFSFRAAAWNSPRTYVIRDRRVWCAGADSSILVKCAPTVRELLIFIPFNKRTIRPLSVERDEAQQAASGGDFLSVSYSDIIILTCLMGFNGLTVGQAVFVCKWLLDAWVRTNSLDN